MNKHSLKGSGRQEQEEKSGKVEKACYAFLYPLLVVLDHCPDRRLVGTFLCLVMAVIMHRHRNTGLLLSELGGYLKPACQTPAGTKRISNLLHAKGWEAEIVATYLWVQADERVATLLQNRQTALVVWDESVLEKAESIALEGLCAVRSSKARLHISNASSLK